MENKPGAKVTKARELPPAGNRSIISLSWISHGIFSTTEEEMLPCTDKEERGRKVSLKDALQDFVAVGSVKNAASKKKK